MNYIQWRKENEDKYLSVVDAGEVLPCIQESSQQEISSTVIPALVDQIRQKKLVNPISFPSVFAEYLHETYHVSPVDIECFLQTSYQIFMDYVIKQSADIGAMFTDVLLHRMENDVTEEDLKEDET